MQYNFGKILEYNGIQGTILTQNDTFIFLTENENLNFKKGDLVIFRPEEIHNVKRAFFVKKVTEEELKRKKALDKTL